MENRTERFVKFFVFEGTPNPAVTITAEIRKITNEKHGNYGKCSLYTDSHYEPLNIRERLEIEEAKALLEKEGFVSVKSDFDKDSIEDLKEIKHLIPEKWVYWFNAALEAYK